MFAFHYTFQEHAILIPNSENLPFDSVLNDQDKTFFQDRLLLNTNTDFGGGCNYGNYLMVCMECPGQEFRKGTYPVMVFHLHQLLDRIVQDARMHLPAVDVSKLIYFNNCWAHGNQDEHSIVFQGNVECFVQQLATQIAAENAADQEELEAVETKWKLPALDLLDNIRRDLDTIRMHEDIRNSLLQQCDVFSRLLAEVWADAAKVPIMNKAICNLTGSARLFFMSKHIDVLSQYVQQYHMMKFKNKKMGGNELVIKLPIYATAEYGYDGFQKLGA